MDRKRNRKAFTIVELVIVIAVIAILATVLVPTFGDVIKKAEDSKAMQEAKNSYTGYLLKHDGIAPEFMVYQSGKQFVAIDNGAAVGVYANTDDAIAALVDHPDQYIAVQSLTNKMYCVLPMSDLDISDYDISEYVGKKIACIGDSVTYGVGANPNPNYEKNLGAALNSVTVNLGTSGTSLCDGGGRDCQFPELNETDLQGADIVTIYLGVNDWAAAGNHANGQAYYALGTPDSTDTSTIYGAMKMWCDKIEELKSTEQYKNTQFFFITPHLTSWNNSVIGNGKDWDQNKRNIHGYTQKEMSEAIKAVCDGYGIPVVDMFDYTCKLYDQDPTKYLNEYAGDGVHPTAACHKLMADYILLHFAV